MAISHAAGIQDSWASLRQNPVFRRELFPRGMRAIIRSPIVRAVLLTAAALAAFEGFQYYFLRIPFVGIIALAVLFWFLVEAMQRWFCWVELSALARTGTLDDYLNSGLAREDVALGVIYPAVISEIVAVTGVMGYFLLTAQNRTIQIVLLIIIILNARRLFQPPFIFLPDAESYLRKRNPLALFFISIAVVVPLLIWFAIYYAFFFGFILIAGLLKMNLTGTNLFLAAFIATFFVSRYPMNWWQMWRLKRFYRRYGSFDDMFDRYVEQG